MPPSIQQSASGIVGKMLERQSDTPTRQMAVRTIGPFHQDQRSRTEDLVPRERFELSRAIQAVQVEVVDGRPRRLVLLHERERGTGDLTSHAVALADRLDE